MKSKGLDEADVYFKQVGKDEYLFGTLKQEGKATSEVLKEIVPAAIKGVTFPKAMRWGGKNMKFARPIRWMVALLNDEVLPINLEGIVASNVTKGHRFLGRKEIEVFSIEDYFKQLSKNFVVLDQNVRKEAIKSQAEEVAKSLGGEVEIEDDLLEEITYLVEYPTAFYGEFNKDYVKLPKEVVTTPMKEHQRYFPVSKEGKLLPYFIAVRNGDKHAIDIVKAGNEKVLEARLADALFFYDEDIKKPLESFVENLKTVVFDEADEMLFMGFKNDIETIMKDVPKKSQVLCFSATMDSAVKKLAYRYMSDPSVISIKSKEVTLDNIIQEVVETTDRNKQDSLCKCLDKDNPFLSIIFCRTKVRVDKLEEDLSRCGYNCAKIHSDVKQSKRERIMKSFRNADIQYLIATDVAARGIDVTGVTHIYNYDIPETVESYIHRIGRCGRAGEKGYTCLFIDPKNQSMLEEIENTIKFNIPKRQLID